MEQSGLAGGRWERRRGCGGGTGHLALLDDERQALALRSIDEDADRVVAGLGEGQVPHVQTERQDRVATFARTLGANGGRRRRQLLTVRCQQQELQLIISSMRGIESASVLYDLRDKRAFGQEAVNTASVSVRPEGGLPLDASQVRAIRHSVSSAFAGLKPEQVTVNDLNGTVHVGNNGTPGSGDSADDPVASRKMMYEQEWNNKIRRAVSFIPAVLVETNVEIDPQSGHEENVTTYDTKGVVYNQRETTGTKSVEPAPPAGSPGLGSQGGVNQAAKIGSGSAIKSSEETLHSESQTKVPTTHVHKTQHGLTPKDVKVAIGIPSSYYEKVWQLENPVAAGEQPKKSLPADLDRIKERVKVEVERATVALLPPTEQPVDRYPRINVYSFADFPVAAPSAPGMQDHALAWLAQNWSTLGMVGLTLVGLLFLRSMIRSVPLTAPAAALAADAPPNLSLVTGGDETSDEPTSRRSRQAARRLGAFAAR